jgi:hypothetical protein
MAVERQPVMLVAVLFLQRGAAFAWVGYVAVTGSRLEGRVDMTWPLTVLDSSLAAPPPGRTRLGPTAQSPVDTSRRVVPSPRTSTSPNEPTPRRAGTHDGRRVCVCNRSPPNRSAAGQTTMVCSSPGPVGDGFTHPPARASRPRRSGGGGDLILI